MTCSITISASGLNPYPDFTSMTVAPDRSRESMRGFASASRSSGEVAAVARMVLQIPPPEARMRS